MAFEYFESEEYHDLISSDQRPALISPEVYFKFIPTVGAGVNILDFGCGSGYVSLLYANRFIDETDFHIYACDYQEELLDLLWRKRTQKDLTNITPFFMPFRSRQHFPKWLPQFKHIILSLSLANAIDQTELLKSFLPLMLAESELHIIEWDIDKQHPLLDLIIPPKRRLSLDDVNTFLSSNGFTVIKEYTKEKMYFALSARVS